MIKSNTKKEFVIILEKSWNENIGSEKNNNEAVVIWWKMTLHDVLLIEYVH